MVRCDQNKALRNRAVFDLNLRPHALEQSARRHHISQTGHVINDEGLSR
jgi:hypothetical protein